VHPRLLTTPFFTIYTFGVLLATAYLAALWWLVRAARRAHVDVEAVTSLGTWAIVGALVGAKVLLLARSIGESGLSATDPWSLASSAGDFYGGFIGGVVAAALFFWRHRTIPFWLVADLAAPAIALGQAIGRIGCFMAGDDYGRPTTVPWAVTFTNPEAARIGGAPLGVPLHPVQLYESLVCALLFVVLLRLERRRHHEGDVILAYTMLYAAARFVLEFYRGDPDRGFVFGGLLSTSQFIGVIMFVLAAILWVRRRRATRRGAERLGVDRSNRRAERHQGRT
jgi:phosphatidylglycerol:prolipoprotein diacylglycerol transferase